MKRSFIFILCLNLLAGCSQKDKSFQYLMEHPREIQSILNDCAQRDEKGVSEAQCVTAQQAANHLRDLIVDFKQDPQKFGQLILQAQMLITQDKKTLHDIYRDLADATKSNQKETIAKLTKEAQQAREHLTELQHQYHQYMSVIRLQGI